MQEVDSHEGKVMGGKSLRGFGGARCPAERQSRPIARTIKVIAYAVIDIVP